MLQIALRLLEDFEKAPPLSVLTITLFDKVDGLGRLGLAHGRPERVQANTHHVERKSYSHACCHERSCTSNVEHSVIPMV